MKPKRLTLQSRRELERERMIEYMLPFAPLFTRLTEDQRLAEASKQFYLTGKQFHYIAGIAGHVPVLTRIEQ